MILSVRGAVWALAVAVAQGSQTSGNPSAKNNETDNPKDLPPLDRIYDSDLSTEIVNAIMASLLKANAQFQAIDDDYQDVIDVLEGPMTDAMKTVQEAGKIDPHLLASSYPPSSPSSSTARSKSSSFRVGAHAQDEAGGEDTPGNPRGQEIINQYKLDSVTFSHALSRANGQKTRCQEKKLEYICYDLDRVFQRLSDHRVDYFGVAAMTFKSNTYRGLVWIIGGACFGVTLLAWLLMYIFCKDCCRNKKDDDEKNEDADYDYHDAMLEEDISNKYIHDGKLANGQDAYEKYWLDVQQAEYDQQAELMLHQQRLEQEYEQQYPRCQEPNVHQHEDGHVSHSQPDNGQADNSVVTFSHDASARSRDTDAVIRECVSSAASQSSHIMDHGPSALKSSDGYSFPEHHVSQAKSGVISSPQARLSHANNFSVSSNDPSTGAPLKSEISIESVERALALCNGNVDSATEMLMSGIDLDDAEEAQRRQK